MTALDGKIQIDAIKELDYISPGNLTSFDEAHQFCHSQGPGWYLPAFNDSQLYFQVVDIMEKENLKSIWMGIKKITYDRLKWLDGTGEAYFYTVTEVAILQLKLLSSC